MIRQQFTLYLENRPGELAMVAMKLAKEGINIDGISVAESTDVAIVQMVVSNSASMKRILIKSRIPFTTQNVALVKMKNKPGALAKILSQLSRKKININYIYATGCNCGNGCSCNAVLSAQSLKKVETAWAGVSG
jgi:hypothetical protein